MNRNDKEFMVEHIRTQYTEKQSTELDELCALDAKVKAPANTFGYVFGSIGAVIMGAGMSLVMEKDFAAWFSLGEETALFAGIAIGAVGLVMALVNYPIYKSILASRRKKYAGKILELSDKIMEGK